MEYRMDTAGILHMSVKGKGKTNTFRLAVTFNEKICPERLNEAFHKIAGRFPTIAAGVRCGLTDHFVVPVKECPDVRRDKGALLYMPDEEIESCGVRVLYNDKSIITEFFHPLTDGHGGITFTKALIDEYMGCKAALRGDSEESVKDSFLEYAGNKKLPMNKTLSFLPAREHIGDKIRFTAGVIRVSDLLDAAHRYKASMTVFLTAVMAEALAEMQDNCVKGKKRPIQIMVPINLRNIFPSGTLRNFALYALVKRDPGTVRPIEEIISDTDRQMKAQLEKSHLSAMMATNASLKRNAVLKRVPLKVKCFCVKTGFMLLGEKTSSLTLSNMGRICFNESYADKIVRTDFILTPRLNAAYNCAVISFRDTVCINFSRTCDEPVLERIFFRKLTELGVASEIETDGNAVGKDEFNK